jgi:hypothetical protein
LPGSQRREHDLRLLKVFLVVKRYPHLAFKPG